MCTKRTIDKEKRYLKITARKSHIYPLYNRMELTTHALTEISDLGNLYVVNANFQNRNNINVCVTFDMGERGCRTMTGHGAMTSQLMFIYLFIYFILFIYAGIERMPFMLCLIAGMHLCLRNLRLIYLFMLA